MSLVEEKMVFFTNLEYLGREIREHRDAIINRDIFFTNSSSINDMVSDIKVFKDKISTLKKKVSSNLEEDIDKYFASEINYLDDVTNAMKVILKNINNNIHSDGFAMENSLLYQTAFISKLNFDIDDLEKKALYYSFFAPKGDGVTTIDGRCIKTADISKYNGLSKYLDCAKNKYNTLEDEIDKLNVKNEDHAFISFSGQSMIESDLKRIDEILNGSGKKKNVTLFGKSYYVPRTDVKEFKTLMYRINKYGSSQDNSMPMIIDNPLFSNVSGKLVIPKKDNRKCKGLISGDGLNFDDSYESHSHYYDSKYKFIGKIGVIEDTSKSDEDEVVYNMGREVSKHHKYNKKKKTLFNILSSRKANDIKKIRKSIITASVAVAMSLVTAVSVFGLSKFNFGKNDDNIVTTSAISIDSDKKVSNLSSSNIKDNVENRTINNSYIGASYSDVKKEMILEISSNDSTSIKNEFAFESITDNEEFDEQKICLDDEVLIDDDALIYTNCIDASNTNEGLDPYYDSDVKRTVRGVAFKTDDSIVYTYSQEEYDYLVNSGAEISAVCCDDGFYNVDDINKTLVRR